MKKLISPCANHWKVHIKSKFEKSKMKNSNFQQSTVQTNPKKNKSMCMKYHDHGHDDDHGRDYDDDCIDNMCLYCVSIYWKVGTYGVHMFRHLDLK